MGAVAVLPINVDTRASGKVDLHGFGIGGHGKFQYRTGRRSTLEFTGLHTRHRRHEGSRDLPTVAEGDPRHTR